MTIITSSTTGWFVLFLVLFVSNCHGEKDPNNFFLDSDSIKGFRMFYKDSINVLEEIENFSALYIRVHGCVWSEYGGGVEYDDDGENHDGDEHWYLTRTQPFRANAAYSLYGVKKGSFNLFGGCNKHTYINSFFTYDGADTIVNALSLRAGIDSDSYGNAYCYSENSNGNNNRNGGTSYTMGCTEDLKFAKALFAGADCDGNYFLNITEKMGRYNRALKGVSCKKVWDRSKYRRQIGNNMKNNYGNFDDGSSNQDDAYYNNNEEEDDGARRRLLALNATNPSQTVTTLPKLLRHSQENAVHPKRIHSDLEVDQQAPRELEDAGDDYANSISTSSYSSVYGSVAETLLMSSVSCDLDLYPNGLCPDPYGIKRKYMAYMHAVTDGRSVMFAGPNLQRNLRIFATLFFLFGTFMFLFGYFVKNKQRIDANGGKIWGTLHCMLDDAGERIRAARASAASSIRAAAAKARERRAVRNATGTSSSRSPRKKRARSRSVKKSSSKRRELGDEELAGRKSYSFDSRASADIDPDERSRKSSDRRSRSRGKKSPRKSSSPNKSSKKKAAPEAEYWY